MTLKTSCRSINPFWRMLSFTLRKNIGFIVVLCAAALMYCPGSFISVILSKNNGYSSSYTQIFAMVVASVAGAVSVGFNLINFTFLYKKSAGDVFHSFPLTRCQLLLSRAFSGIASTLIPTIVAYVSFCILVIFNSWLGNLDELLVYFIHTVLIVLVCSAFSLIFVVCAGGMFDLVVSLIIVNLSVLLVGNIFTHTLTSTLIGYSDSYTHGILYNLSIPYFCYRGIDDANIIVYDRINADNIEFYIRSVVYILGFGGISVLLYNRRKAEKGGSAYAYNFMYLICGILVGICGGYIIGMIFCYEPYQLAYWIFMGLGAVLCSTVYGVASNRGFKKVWRSVAVGGMAVAVSAIVAIIGATGAFGYVDRVPKAEDISSATVMVMDEGIELDNPNEILKLHSEIINTDAAQYDYNNYDHRISFEYTLKNGKTMSRDFYVKVKPIANTLLGLYTNGERIDKCIDKIKKDKFDSIIFDCDRGDIYGMATINKAEAIAFLEAYKKDLAACDTSILTENWKYSYSLSGNYVSSVGSDHYYFNFKTYNGFTNSSQYLIDSGILSRVTG